MIDKLELGIYPRKLPWPFDRRQRQGATQKFSNLMMARACRGSSARANSHPALVRSRSGVDRKLCH
jgi:hypothetical protein